MISSHLRGLVFSLVFVGLSCRHAAENTGLAAGEYTSVVVPAQSTSEAAFVDPSAKSHEHCEMVSYSAQAPIDNVLESGRWTFVRGIRFPMTWLLDGRLEEHGLAFTPVVLEYLKNAKDLETNDSQWVTRTGKFKVVGDPTDYCQLATFVMSCDLTRSSSTAGGGGKAVRITNAAFSVFGSAAAMRISCPSWLCGDPDTAHGIEFSATVRVVVPSPDGGQQVAGSFELAPPGLSRVRASETSVDAAMQKLVPAVAMTSRASSDWFVNESKVSNVYFIVTERSR